MEASSVWRPRGPSVDAEASYIDVRGRSRKPPALTAPQRGSDASPAAYGRRQDRSPGRPCPGASRAVWVWVWVWVCGLGFRGRRRPRVQLRQVSPLVRELALGGDGWGSLPVDPRPPTASGVRASSSNDFAARLQHRPTSESLVRSRPGGEERPYAVCGSEQPACRSTSALHSSGTGACRGPAAGDTAVRGIRTGASVVLAAGPAPAKVRTNLIRRGPSRFSAGLYPL